ncbi:transcriptional regulator, TetR family [Pseudomonas fluorescens WH6]|nr:transcriptional regulator, TetR family [Pseudomonas fluorescens WH6]
MTQEEFQYRALALFQTRSFSQVSMRELAAHVGISPGAIYHHVESKEALLFQWLMELYQALLSHVELVRKRRLTPAQRLTKLIECHLQLHEHMHAHFKLAVMDAGCLSASMQDSVRRVREAYEAEILSLVEQLGQGPGGPLREGALTVILPMLNSLPAWLNPMMERAQRRVITRTLVNALVQAIKSLP